MPTQGELLPPEPRSLHQSRLRKFDRVNPERVYAAYWKRQNRRGRSGWSGGATLLELILRPDGQEWPGPVTRRDAAVAASVVQWLGTNCGLSMIWECERQIDKLRRTEREARLRPSLNALQREADEQPARPVRFVSMDR